MTPEPASFPAADSGSRARTWLAAGLLAGAAFLAYANSFHGPFVFDDVPSIVENPTIRQLWPPAPFLFEQIEGGNTVSGRPILNFSLAVNYAISGLDPWSYHVFNLLIHVLAGLTLFGLVRRTLSRPPLVAQYGGLAWPLALVIAGLWVLHPLQAEAVTYVAQRAESLMGLFFLLTLYAFARAADSPRPWLWRTVSLLACLLGIGTKEVTALAPVMVLLYDRTFVSGSFTAAWRRHRWWHLALAATWLPLAWLVLGTGGDRGGTMGFGIDMPWTSYWMTQLEAVTRYLGLSCWPHPLVFDYGQIPAPGAWAAVLWAVPVLGLAGATLFALWRRPAAGFLGAWFFGILAPTSIVPSMLQRIVEHRMYLPLAAVITLVAAAAAPRLGPRRLLAAGLGLALAAGTVTWQRNRVYQDEALLWRDTLAKRPDNARAHNNLGRHYYGLGRWDEAIACYREALRLEPRMVVAQCNLGLALQRTGRLAEAIAPLETAVRLQPSYAKAQMHLGIVLTKLGRAREALPHFAAALHYDPWPAELHFHGGVALAQLGLWPQAIAHYARCLQLNPRHAEAHSNWGTALMAMQSVPEAIGHFETALRLRPEMPEVHFNLGQAYSALDRRADALAQYAETIRLDPTHALAHLNLGIALAQAGKVPEALGHLQEAVRLQPDSPEMHANLAVALDLAGRQAEAQAQNEQAAKLRAKP